MKSFQYPRLKKSVVVLGAILVTGCAGYELGNARDVEPTGDAFSTALYKEYMLLSELEFTEADYKDSDAFALRAVGAAAGNPTAPEALDMRNLPGAHKGALAQARRELAEVLDATATEKAPVNAAVAQASFDCWMQEQEENFQPEDIERCKGNFVASMKAIRAAMAPKPAAAAAAPAPAPAPAPKATERMFATYTVNFDFDSADITRKAGQIIAEAGAAIDEMKPGTVIISGYTDRAGSASYNMRLGEKRAKVVQSALDIRSRVSIGKLTEMRVYGEKNNKVKTEDGVREPANRRVKIEIIR